MNLLFPLIAASIWGGNAVVAKAAVGVIAPIDYGFLRWVFAVAILTPFVAPSVRRNWSQLRPHLGRLFVLGVLGGAAFPGFMYFAARSTTATNIGIIQSIMPVMSLGLAVLWLGHRPSIAALFGTLLSLIGVAFVVSHGDPASLLSTLPNHGDLLMLAATASYTVYTVLLKQWNLGIALLQSVYLQAWASSLVFLPFFLFSEHYPFQVASVPLVVYATVLGSILAPWAWLHGVNRIGPARASLFFNLIPVIATGLAIALLGERPDTSLLLGGALVIAGVVIAELGERRAQAARSRSVDASADPATHAERI